MGAFAAWLREIPTRVWRGSTQRSIHSIHARLSALRAFCRWLAEEGYLDRAPVVSLPQLPDTIFPVLTDVQVQ